jgi:hypothetical protein
MRVIAIVALALLATGCATQRPHEMVQQMSKDSPKYATPECAAARKLAIEYDENVPSRMGLGLGLGLLLGPFGLPFAIAADVSQADKRKAVAAEVEKNCT